MISISEAAKILGINIRTLQRWDIETTIKELEKEKGEGSENNN